MARLLLVLTLVIAGPACTQRNPDYCDDSGDCAAGEICNLTPGDGLIHECVQIGIDAPLAVDGGTTDARIPCTPDGGGCPAGQPICSAGFCAACDVGGTQCPNPGAPVCLPGGTCGACGEDLQCEDRDATPRCLAGSCVECDRHEDCARFTTRPTCDLATGACRACRSDVECGGICDTTTGSCVAAGSILRLVEGAVGDCVTSACGSIALALSKVDTTRRWLLLDPGTYREAVSIGGLTVNLVGGGAGVTIDSGASPNVPVVNVSGGANVTLRRLRLANADGDASATGVACSGVPPPALTLSDMRVEGNDGVGVSAGPCVLTMQRSRVSQNNGGGVRILASSFTLLNNLIVANGNRFSTVGGVRIVDDPPGGAAAARFEHNTVAGNTATTTVAGGVACEALTVALGFANDIVHSNFGAAEQVSGLCSWRFSAIAPAVAGEGNISDDPLFLDPENRNFDLDDRSPAIDTADPQSTVRDDVDGNPRPLGPGPDMGAFEVR